MFKKLLLWVRQRKKHLLGILLVLPIFVVLLPMPISKGKLVSNEWCPIYPRHKWIFLDDGSFEQFDGWIGGDVAYYDKGIWTQSAVSIQVTIQKSELLRNQSEFRVRSAGLGRFLWSYGNFLGGDDKGVFIVFPCELSR